MFEFGIFLVDYINDPMAAHYLALRGSFFDRNSYFHCLLFLSVILVKCVLFVTVSDAAFGEVVGRHLDLHLVARQDFDVVHAHLA